jgi:hypothetical protein
MASFVVSDQEVNTLPAYQYNPLEGSRYIRLVELFPGKEEEVIHCALRHVSLDSEPNFEALSYVWGDPEDVQYIICDGCKLNITANLGQALRAFRPEADESVRVLWIDAIAINQQDLEERSAQVQLMDTIYGLATSVPIWLGPADDETKEAYDMIAQISTAFKRICVTPEYIEATRRGDKFSIKDFNIPDANEGGWPSLTKLLQRPWFDRVWVLQEAILAQKALIKCGNFTEDLRSLEMVLISLYRTSEWHHSFLTWNSRYYMFEANIKSTMQLRKIRAEKQYEDLREEKFELYSLVQEARHREATNPRDKIYSMLGLASDLHTYPLRPDYTLPVSRVYTDFTRRRIQQSGNLACFLDLASFGHRREELTIPSWVADWRAAPVSREIFLKRKKPFCASLSSTANIGSSSTKHQDDAMLLSLRGLHLTTVVERSNGSYPEIFEKHIVGDFYSKTGERLDSLTLFSHLGTKDLYPNYFEVVEEFENVSSQEMSSQEQETAMLALLQNPYIHPPHSELDAGHGKFNFFSINYMSDVFVSNDGYVGTSDGWTKAGDEIWLLEGADRPYTLRRNEHGMHIIVEEVFVHGVMYGEAWPSAEGRLQEVVLA